MRPNTPAFTHLRAAIDDLTGGTHRHQLDVLAATGCAGLTLISEAPAVATLAADLADLDPADRRRLRTEMLDALTATRNERVKAAAEFDALASLGTEALANAASASAPDGFSTAAAMWAAGTAARPAVTEQDATTALLDVTTK